MREPRVTQPISESVTDKNALVVDDVSDTGWSLKVATEYLLEKSAASVRTVTIYFKPHSIFKPDYFAGTTSDWIIFPWERLEATRHLLEEARMEGRNQDSVRLILKRCNLSDSTIDRLLQLAAGTS
jgi:hypoxanthine phosphoribosyltransferase